ncbi:unnamed protein product [Effrenium voratum]|nr:unnamed protein product [Effrenium voratum]
MSDEPPAQANPARWTQGQAPENGGVGKAAGRHRSGGGGEPRPGGSWRSTHPHRGLALEIFKVRGLLRHRGPARSEPTALDAWPKARAASGQPLLFFSGCRKKLWMMGPQAHRQGPMERVLLLLLLCLRFPHCPVFGITMEDGSLLIGKTALIQGLVRSPEFNGQWGVVESYDPQMHRFLVSVVLPSQAPHEPPLLAKLRPDMEGVQRPEKWGLAACWAPEKMPKRHPFGETGEVWS